MATKNNAPKGIFSPSSSECKAEEREKEKMSGSNQSYEENVSSWFVHLFIHGILSVSSWLTNMPQVWGK